MGASVIYCGEVFTKDPEWRFNVSKIPVEDAGRLGFKAEHPYFQSSNYSSQYFEERVLNTPLHITDYMTLIYSKDANVCREFVVGERERMLEEARNTILMIENASFPPPLRTIVGGEENDVEDKDVER